MSTSLTPTSMTTSTPPIKASALFRAYNGAVAQAEA
jgi:hypothetical protein